METAKMSALKNNSVFKDLLEKDVLLQKTP
jgi:hypothetical protein